MKIRLGIFAADEDPLLMLYLEDAHAFILGYTNRRVIPAELKSAWVNIAINMYGRRGLEGESKQTIGDVSRVAETLPTNIQILLNNWRLGKVLQFHARA
ncbi:MAG: phage head-tail connector protein [Oscillospiraceae bacterium]|jgi:hypothetical protein|nr:phage head-tail connector protein [Oscillospiraceae bacterium]